MRIILLAISVMTMLCASALGQDWWEELDWTLISDAPGTGVHYASLHGAHDADWVYFRLELAQEENPFDDGGLTWMFDAGSGNGYHVWGVFESDARMVSAGEWGSAVEMYDDPEGWTGDPLKAGEGGPDYGIDEADYQPFDEETNILYYRVRRDLWSDAANRYIFQDPFGVFVLRGDETDSIYGAYTIDRWWEDRDWTLISDTPAGDYYNELYGAHDDQWLYLRVEQAGEFNMYDDGGFGVHIDANEGTGFDLNGWGWFLSDIELLTGAIPSAQMQTNDGWHAGALTIAEGGADYTTIMQTDWNQPYNVASGTYYLRIDREQLYHPLLGDYVIADGNTDGIGVAVRAGADNSTIAGVYHFNRWWEDRDWTLISDTPHSASNYASLHGAHDEDWVYFRLDMSQEENPFDDGFMWMFDAGSGNGFPVMGGTFFSDARLWSAGEWGTAIEMADDVWDGGPLKAGEGGSNYAIAQADYQPYNVATTSLFYRVNRNLWSDRADRYIFGGESFGVFVLRTAEDDYIYGDYHFNRWWEDRDWTLISDTPHSASNYASLHGAHDEDWVYFRLDLAQEENPFDDGFMWMFDAGSGNGFPVMDGTFFSDARLWSAGEWGTAIEMADGVWDGDPLKAGEGGLGYQIAEADYQPFNAVTPTLFYRVNRNLWSDRADRYIFGGESFGVFVLRTAEDDYIYGDYTFSDDPSMEPDIMGLSFLGNDEFEIRYIGEAGQVYGIEATEDLMVQPDPVWTPVRTTTADFGETTATVTNEAPRAVYRLRAQ